MPRSLQGSCSVSSCSQHLPAASSTAAATAAVLAAVQLTQTASLSRHHHSCCHGCRIRSLQTFKQLFAEIDDNGNGRMSYAEFHVSCCSSALLCLLVRAQHEQRSCHLRTRFCAVYARWAVSSQADTCDVGTAAADWQRGHLYCTHVAGSVAVPAQSMCSGPLPMRPPLASQHVQPLCACSGCPEPCICSDTAPTLSSRPLCCWSQAYLEKTDPAMLPEASSIFKTLDKRMDGEVRFKVSLVY